MPEDLNPGNVTLAAQALEHQPLSPLLEGIHCLLNRGVNRRWGSTDNRGVWQAGWEVQKVWEAR